MWLYTHADCLSHDPGEGHPEHAGRLQAVLDGLRGFGARLCWRDAPLATHEQLSRAHTTELLQTLEQLAPAQGRARLDADTQMSPGSLAASRRAAGAICAAIDAVMAGPQRRAFCAVRPPGHHSTAAQAMGFCLYNTIAIGAHHAAAAHGLQRIAIVDFDVHHGNGTQAIVERDPRMLFVSSHQSPLYPGSGHPDERGVGNLINAPLPPGSGSADFRRLWSEQLLPAIDDWAPQLLLVSAGFDAHRLDPLADLNLQSEDYAWISRALAQLAERHAEGRLVSTLEGGYSLTALREGSTAHVAALLGD